MGYTFVLGLILLSGATLGLQLRLYFCMIGGNKFLQAVDNKQEELLCRAMGLNYERIKAVHDGISPMDTPLPPNLSRCTALGAQQSRNNGAQSKTTTGLLMFSL